MITIDSVATAIHSQKVELPPISSFLNEDFRSLNFERKAKVGRPSKTPKKVTLEIVEKAVGQSLGKDLNKVMTVEPAPQEFRTDIVRMNLLRKAISIPKAILDSIEHPNTIKEMNPEVACKKYTKCFLWFAKLCKTYDIEVPVDDREAFKAFIALKFPLSKTKCILSRDDPLYNELKKYLKEPTIKAMDKLKKPASMKILIALLKLTNYMLGMKLNNKTNGVIENIIRLFRNLLPKEVTGHKYLGMQASEQKDIKSELVNSTLLKIPKSAISSSVHSVDLE